MRVVGSRRKGSRKRSTVLTGGQSELLMEVLLHPRGSGNRNLAVALAKAFRAHPELSPHVRKVRAGYSKVWVHFTPSMALAQVMMEWQATRAAHPDVPGQLPLFGGPVA
jgi:hypothetical protein